MAASYEAIAWLRPDSDFDPGRLEEKFREWLPGAAVTRRGPAVEASLDGWRVLAEVSDEPDVAEDAADTAGRHADDPRGERIKGCTRCVTVWCPDDDPGLDRFNDFVFACQALEEFRGVVLYDPRTDDFM